MPARRTFRHAVVGAIAVVLASSCGGQGPAALVGSHRIDDAEVVAAAAVLRSIFGVQSGTCGTLDGDTDTQEAACNRLALSALIPMKLADDYATANGVTVDAAAVTTAIEDFEGQFGGDVLRVSLEENGATRQQFETLIRGSLLQDEVAKALTIEMLGEDGLLAAYERGLADLTIVQVDHILVGTEAEANDVYDRVTGPGATRDDFLALAGKVSTDPTVQQNEGSLGSSYASGYTQAFADAVLAMQVGDISRPVETEFGWHVINMVDKEVTPFDEAREGIVQAESGPIFFDWVRARVDEGDVEVDPRFGRYDREGLRVARISSTDPSAVITSPTPVNAAPG